MPTTANQYFAYGPSLATLHANMWPDFDDGVTKGTTPVTFQMVFGILFPAMTGIMAGTNMSGTLLTY